MVEVLAGIPSVVLGFLGIIIFASILRRIFDLPTGLTAFTGSILLGLIAIPTIVSVAEYRDAAIALGATEWQTIWRVTLPAARSGVITAIMLGIGRSIGETMAVMMVTGNAPVLNIGIRQDGRGGNWQYPLPCIILYSNCFILYILGCQCHCISSSISAKKTF
jgi:phosphate transport system permease protein